MKITHLSTFDTGGAAVAALRLHDGLLSEGINSRFLSLYTYLSESATRKDYKNFLKSDFKERIISSIKYRTRKAFYKENDGFNYPFSPYNVHKHPLIREADIVHLHWVSRFVDLPSFIPALKKLNKPIVWTLHDLNPITGGYHYFGEGPIDTELNNKYLAKKKSLVQSYNSISLVSPSKWIYDLILESGFVKKEKVHHIKYGIDLHQFLPVNRTEAKIKLKINPSKKVVLFLASDVEDQRKGLEFFLKAIPNIEEKENVQFICVGSGNFEKPVKVNFTFLGSISDRQELVSVYSAADVFVIPSLEDNLPNTIIESLACGTPVVGFNTGGIPDLILDNYNGFLAKKRDEKDLARKINHLLRNQQLITEFSNNARTFIEENCDNQIQSKKYMELYNLILNKNL